MNYQQSSKIANAFFSVASLENMLNNSIIFTVNYQNELKKMGLSHFDESQFIQKTANIIGRFHKLLNSGVNKLTAFNRYHRLIDFIASKSGGNTESGIIKERKAEHAYLWRYLANVENCIKNGNFYG